MSIAAVPEEHCAVLGWRARPAILPHEAQACRDDGRDESIAQGSQHPISMITHGSQHPISMIAHGSQHPISTIAHGSQHPISTIARGSQHPISTIT